MCANARLCGPRRVQWLATAGQVNALLLPLLRHVYGLSSPKHPTHELYLPIVCLLLLSEDSRISAAAFTHKGAAAVAW